MKNIKKLLSIVMVLTLVLALGAQAFAADVIIGGHHDVGSTYNAYELMTATYLRDDTINGKAKAVYEYHIASGMRDVIAAGIAAVTDAGAQPKYEEGNDAKYEREVLEFLKGLNETQIRKFADEAFKKIQAAEPAITPFKHITVTDENSGDIRMTGMNGYYLIAETLASPEPNSAVTSLVMLNTVGKEELNITTKEDVPTSKKEVQERDNNTGATTWQDSADYNVGDYVPFKLTAKIQNEGFGEYKTYYLGFVDTLSSGLTYVNDTVHPLKVMLGETDVTDYFAVNYDAGKLTITREDVKTIPGVVAGSEFTVTYYAQLNEGAVRSVAGNPNTMYIEYSNNPNGDQEGKGRTPDDKVTVFTFDLHVDKVDGNEQPLTGAAFALLKKVTDDDSVDKTGAAVLPVVGQQKSVTIAVDSVYYTEKDDVRTYYQAVKTIEAGTITKFEFNGLDEGEYLLVETTVPDGYNAIDPIEITITATYDESDPPVLKDLTVDPATFHATVSSSLVEGTVINQSGLELPSTGGIGTTIFYVVGAILVAGAVILLVTKKRASDANK